MDTVDPAVSCIGEMKVLSSSYRKKTVASVTETVAVTTENKSAVKSPTLLENGEAEDDSLSDGEIQEEGEVVKSKVDDAESHSKESPPSFEQLPQKRPPISP